MTEHHLSTTSFESLGLPDPLLQGVRAAGFEFCTPIQAEALPHALAGRDVAGQAQTGTGKTAAFLLATLNHLLKTPPPEGRKPTSPRAVMFAPTRELAVQIDKDAQSLAQFAGFKRVLVYGGTGYEQQRRDLEAGVDILIGTPGRAIDYLKQHVYDMDAVQVMVLDEADRMFDLGFIRDIRFLLRKMPPPEQRLSMLFSATLSYRVTELAYEYMNNPQFVHIEPDKRTADKVTQILYHTAMEEKIPLLVGLLRHTDPQRSLVFINTKDMGERLCAWLKANGFEAAVLSGDVPQPQRLKLLQDFTEGRLPLLVATDVAARGLHIPEVSHVFNFDLPQNAEDYVHRIGRTARAGASGDAVSFACEKYVFSLGEIEEYIGHKLPVGQITPDFLPALEKPAFEPRPERFGRGDRRDRGGRDRGRGERPGRGPREAANRPSLAGGPRLNPVGEAGGERHEHGPRPERAEHRPPRAEREPRREAADAPSLARGPRLHPVGEAANRPSLAGGPRLGPVGEAEAPPTPPPAERKPAPRPLLRRGGFEKPVIG